MLSGSDNRFVVRSVIHEWVVRERFENDRVHYLHHECVGCGALVRSFDVSPPMYAVMDWISFTPSITCSEHSLIQVHQS